MIFVHVHAQYLVTQPRKEQSLDWREESSIAESTSGGRLPDIGSLLVSGGGMGQMVQKHKCVC